MFFNTNHRIRFFYLDAFWYDDGYWKASSGSTLNAFNNGLTIFYDLGSFFNKNAASCKFNLKTWNSYFFQNTKIDVLTQNFQKSLLGNETACTEDVFKIPTLLYFDFFFIFKEFFCQTFSMHFLCIIY